ncbi:MAG TPA: DNA repair protein RecN [Vicinamibacterales bacterium]|nr:DNA repair protein RecN [Vicinamibacterales bacterium]
MLRFLGVRHLAVIERLEVEFEPGLNVLTGETGAGKSVIVDAIDLLVGGRASADLVRTGESAASIQAIFERHGGHEVIVRREVSAQGRSRAFIDDALATTAALRELGATLIDLHGQHEHQTLLDPAEHAAVLDEFAGHGDRVAEVTGHFDHWRAAESALARTQLDDREKRARIEMASFQLQEIDQIAPQAGEDETLAAERVVLANADRLSRLSSDAYSSLYEGEEAALSALAVVWKRLSDLSALDPRFAPYVDQRDDIKSKLEDLAFFLRSYSAGLDAPERLQTVEDRLAALERLKKKYGPTLEAVLDRQRALRDELAELGAGEERTAELESRARDTRASFLHAARELSAARRTAARRLGHALESDLAELAMPNARLDVRVAEMPSPDTWTNRGTDDVELFFSPNPGEELRPLAAIASGGELSRVMLALRTLAKHDEPGRTLVFDEVDVGIGGAAADAVGARLQALGRRHQVICITHLAQIAARAGVHFHTAKHVRGGRTLTSLTRLDDSGREGELARMIAGVEVTPSVLASARDLLAIRRDGEAKAKGETPRMAKAKGRRSGA